jgi:hypothetical protein
MVKFVRVAMIVLAAFGLLVPESRAEIPQSCEIALQRCLTQCRVYPEIFREGCMLGCGIGYLNCGV